MSNIRRRIFIEGAGIERKEIPELPMAAVREAIMNGLAHADYHSGEASSTSIAANLEVSARTARRILADLVEKGAVIVRGATNKRTYTLNDSYF